MIQGSSRSLTRMCLVMQRFKSDHKNLKLDSEFDGESKQDLSYMRPLRGPGQKLYNL